MITALLALVAIGFAIATAVYRHKYITEGKVNDDLMSIIANREDALWSAQHDSDEAHQTIHQLEQELQLLKPPAKKRRAPRKPRLADTVE